MKLYSKQQMLKNVFIAFVSGALIALLAIKIDVFSQKEKSQSTKTESSNLKVENAQDSISQTENKPCAEKQVVSATAQASSSSSLYTQDEEQNIFVYEKCNEAVVNITTQVMGINWFLEPVVQDGGSGSGSIIDRRGYVVTNVHVIDGANKINISLSDGTSYPGRVIGQDAESDIAVLKFDPPENIKLKVIDFGDSETLKVGQKVIAIGNPFALERTMTTGIVSGLGRPIQKSANVIIRNMIQTDAAINPGNSGGPLLDSKGKMIGINTMIISNSGSSAGIGFAVPVSTARRVVSDLLQYGRVRRGTIEITPIQMTQNIAQYAGLQINYGILISSVKKGSNAEKSGLRGGTQAVQYGSRFNPTTIYLGGDIITAIDGIQIRTYADYTSALESKRPNENVTVTVFRNKKYEKITVTLDENDTSLKTEERSL
ncbi:trypsin-like peptidase domain-containing protein [Treponema pectinovorum]|uniref:S1C family serine protease n=1 Tax=Treponema pectinovorum TaxID=164 RepID=UPI003D8F0F54